MVSQTLPSLPARFSAISLSGRGRFSEVWKARDQSLEREIAVKIVALSGRSEAETKRSVFEARVNAKLKHPHILAAYDAIIFNDKLIICSPNLDGGTLDKPAAGLLTTQREKVIAFTKLVEANEYLHRIGWLHCDLKPQNVLLDLKGRPFLTDFGSITSLRKNPSDASNLGLVGTPAYLAPELVAGKTKPTIASEIYALGAVLYHLLAGQPPFLGDTQEVLHQVTTETFPSPRSILPKIDRDLEAIVLTACEYRPRDRYQSTSEFIDDLERYLADEPTLARDPTLESRIHLWCKRNRIGAVLIGSLIAATMFMIVISLVGTSYANSLRTTSIKTREILDAEAVRAAAADERLRTLLASTEEQQKAAEIAEANARELRLQADQSRSQVATATERTSELTNQSASMAEQINSVIASRKTAEAKLTAAKEQSSQLKLKTDQTQYNAVIQAAKSAIETKDWDIANRLLCQAAESQRGLEHVALLGRMLTKGKNEPPKQFGIPKDVDSLVFDRSENQIAIWGNDAVVTVINLRTRARVSLTLTLPASTMQEALVDAELASFNSDGTELAVAYKHSSERSTIAVWNLTVSPPTFQTERINGTVTSLRYLREDGRYGVDRLSRLVKDPLDADGFRVYSGDSNWRVRDGRKSANIPTTPDQKLEVFFVDLGTDPCEGVCFVSAEAETYKFPCVHWLSSGRRVNVNFGDSDISQWPSQWAIHNQTPVGLGLLLEQNLDRIAISSKETESLQTQLPSIDWEKLRDRVRSFKSQSGTGSGSGQWVSNLDQRQLSNGLATRLLDPYRSGRVHLLDFFRSDTLDANEINIKSRFVHHRAYCLQIQPKLLVLHPLVPLDSPDYFPADQVEANLKKMAASLDITYLSGSTFVGNNYYRSLFAISPNGTYLLEGYESTLTLRVGDTGKSVRDLRGQQAYVVACNFSPNGKLIVTAGGDGGVRLFDVETGNLLKTFSGHLKTVRAAEFSSNQKYIVSGGADASVRVWDIEAGKQVYELTGHKGKVNDVSVSPDNKLIASAGDDHSVRIWNLRTGQFLRTLEIHPAPVRSVSFMPDGNRITTRCDDGHLKVFHVESGTIIRDLPGHGGAVSSDGKRAIAPGIDNDVLLLWDIETGAQLAELVGHSGAVRDVALSPDGKYGFSASVGGTIRRWDLTGLSPKK